jgi:ABC-2 type transport system ATP-binding protein/lipopolysaccharide transport system ATP-binding protein
MIRHYLTASLVSSRTGSPVLRGGPVTVREVAIEPHERPGGGALMRLDRLRISVEFDIERSIPDFDMAIQINAANGIRILDETLSDTGAQPVSPGRYQAEMVVPPILNVGDFLVGLWFGTSTAEFLDEPAAGAFALHGSTQRRPERVVAMNLPINLKRVSARGVGNPATHPGTRID